MIHCLHNPFAVYAVNPLPVVLAVASPYKAQTSVDLQSLVARVHRRKTAAHPIRTDCDPHSPQPLVLAPLRPHALPVNGMRERQGKRDESKGRCRSDKFKQWISTTVRCRRSHASSTSHQLRTWRIVMAESESTYLSASFSLLLLSLLRLDNRTECCECFLLFLLKLLYLAFQDRFLNFKLGLVVGCRR